MKCSFQNRLERVKVKGALMNKVLLVVLVFFGLSAVIPNARSTYGLGLFDRLEIELCEINKLLASGKRTEALPKIHDLMRVKSILLMKTDYRPVTGEDQEQFFKKLKAAEHDFTGQYQLGKIWISLVVGGASQWLGFTDYFNVDTMTYPEFEELVRSAIPLPKDLAPMSSMLIVQGSKEITKEIGESTLRKMLAGETLFRVTIKN
jgi:hypothetical protein